MQYESILYCKLKNYTNFSPGLPATAADNGRLWFLPSFFLSTKRYSQLDSSFRVSRIFMYSMYNIFTTIVESGFL